MVLRNLFVTVFWWGIELGAGGGSTKLESQTGNACEAACTFILVMIEKRRKRTNWCDLLLVPSD